MCSGTHILFPIFETQENTLWVTLLDTITNPPLLVFYLEGIPLWHYTRSLEEDQSGHQRSTIVWYHSKQESKTPLMFIITYNSANPNLRELLTRHWSYLGRSSATRELCNHDIMVTYRKPPSLKDMLVRAKIPQPKTQTIKGCTKTQYLSILYKVVPIRENNKPH